ncbi:hypothetical protein H5410_059370 [Solanum commersonii]|uniref:DUF4283 domain-containing protein n=1 Tax=Solanum commersonii TaxID=4109 RepID=A0A9J5W2R2_SOLCO|nr:hypothetical protein H5410_059370 [Solanum commersonii]
MGDDTIYFAVGFKSFDITRGVSRVETWYDWVERGRKMMTRMSISQKTMEWLAFALKEASKGQGNSVCRWKYRDQFAEFFCSRNYNKSGRYVSILKLQGKRRAVIFIPEWSLNSGWLDIATKITRFINVKAHKAVKMMHRETEEGLSYSDTVRNNKWATREMNAAKIQQRGKKLVITDATTTNQNEILAKSVIGSLPEKVSEASLSEIRRWAASTWKHKHGINIYDLGHNRFLFEFPNKTAANHIIRGEWFWKSHKFIMQWWLPTSTSSHNRLDQVWIRVVGLPLQLWSQKVFREIGNLCGGWIRTEEETELRNHLKWARMKVRGVGNSVPKSVELVHEGLTFKVPIWVEMPVKVVADSRSKIPLTTQRFDEGTVGIQDESLLGFIEVTGHVGSSFDPEILNWPAVSACVKARVAEVPLPTTSNKSDAVVKKKNLGPDLLAQFVSTGLVCRPSSSLIDPISAELEANNSNFYITLNCGEGEEAEQDREETEKEDDFHEDSREEEARVILETPKP